MIGEYENHKLLIVGKDKVDYSFLYKNINPTLPDNIFYIDNNFKGYKTGFNCFGCRFKELNNSRLYIIPRAHGFGFMVSRLVLYSRNC